MQELANNASSYTFLSQIGFILKYFLFLSPNIYY